MKRTRGTVLMQAFRKCRGSCCICVALIVVLAVAMNYSAYQLSAITGMLKTGSFTGAMAAFGVYLGLQLLLPVLEMVCNLFQNRAQKDISLYFRNALSEKTLDFSLRDYARHESDYFLNGNVGGIELFNQCFVENLFNCIYFAFLVLCGLVMFWKLYIWLAVSMFCAILLSGFCAHFYDKAVESLSEAYLQKDRTYLSAILDLVNGFLDIYFSRCRTFFCRTAGAHVKAYEQANITYHTKLKALGIGFYLPMFLVDMVVLGLILRGILTGQIGIEVLAAYLSIGGLLLNSGENLFASVAELKSGMAAISWDVLQYQKAPVKTNAKEGSREPVLMAEGGSFSYDGQASISMPPLTLLPGEKLLLCGPSGSGKSTLLKLLTGQLQGMQNGIFLNGQNIHSLSEEALYEKIAYLPQKGHLFQGTLQENIFFEAPVDSRFTEEVLRRSMLTDFVNRHGLDYPITPGGTNLSGGERQRILLARLLAQGKSILLLDEPFANIPRGYGVEIKEGFLRDDRVSMIWISHDETEAACGEGYRQIKMKH